MKDIEKQFMEGNALGIVLGMLNSSGPSLFHTSILWKRVGKKATSQAYEECRAILKRLVDAWIDTGKSGPQRTDTPCGRHLGPCNHIVRAWFERYKPRASMDGKGKLILRHNPPILLPDSLGKPVVMGQERLNSHARDYGTYWFVKLLDSHSPHRLARCANCEKYFAYRRTPQGTIKNGTYCPACKKIHRDSVPRTEASRARRKDLRVGLAAEFWPRWKPDGRYGKQSEWVAKQMNARLEKYKPLRENLGFRLGDPLVTPKWVTQNKKAIKEKVNSPGQNTCHL